MLVYGKVPKSHLKAIAFFSDKLISRQMANHVIIKVTYKNTNDYWGLTIIEDYNVKGKPRHFIIEVKKDLCEKEKLMTIAHEMVHVKQYVYDELNETMTLWRGKRINGVSIPYMKQPWEKEAFRVGDKLFGEYYGNV